MNAKRTAITMFALILGSLLVFAHNGTEHILGTVSAITETSVTVETVKKTSITVAIDDRTQFSKNEASASKKDIKVGDRVVINAKAGADKKLVATTVKVGAMGQMDHGAHKK